MGKMKIGSSGAGSAIQQPEIAVDVSEPIVSFTSIEIAKPVTKEVEVVVEIPKPVTKEVMVEISKPVYVIKEVEQVIQKPKIKVEEIPQVIVKPVFNVKQELQVLDQLQIKLEESVALAEEKVKKINATTAEQYKQDSRVLSKLEAEAKLIKIALAAVIVLSSVSIILSLVK